MEGETLLQFQSFSSAVDVSFWYELAKRKLEVFQLDDRSVTIRGSYATGAESKVGSLLCLSHDSFDQASDRTAQRSFVAPGQLFNSNTIEDFKNMPRSALFEKAAEQITADIESGAAVSDPSLLTRFVLTCHADLKKYIFYYMFGFPALAFPGDAQPTAQPPVSLDHASSPFHGAAADELVNAYESTARAKVGGFCAVRKTATEIEIAPLAELLRLYTAEEVAGGHAVVGFADPCILPAHPGWPLRNLLFLLALKWGVRRVTVLSLRGSKVKSLVFRVSLPAIGAVRKGTPVGWEKNAEGKLVPRVVNLQSSMDPTKLAARSAELNLKLMKWRLLPNLQLTRISDAKCLLIGAGTLGCNLARTLLAWGVRHISFVDNGRVSYSNPVRQSLFTFEDSINGGKPKASCAAERLAHILPGIVTKGYALTVPMPGHPVAASDMQRVGNDITQLLELIRSHDVVFLGTDSRESRWLPSVLAAVEGKLVINAALGFDTYLVMRHGMTGGSHRLGCYFCNDVVAPGDSQKDRTLDQQCTVTRPGVSSMAAALAVELFVAVLHHKEGGHAPAEVTDEMDSGLGLLPHQIRGFLCTYKELLVAVEAYDRCTACSPTVLEQYKKRGLDFLFEAFQNPKYLEDLTGLTQLKHEAQSAASFELQAGDDF